MADGTLKFDTSIDSGGLQKGLGGLGDIAKNALGVFSGQLMTKAVDGIAQLGKSALDSVGQLEQNVGGVETLFGSAADTVIASADNAYKTAGLSANEYMSTVTSFSASLLQSLDGDVNKAASSADQALVDMSDNANKMGTDMGSIQQAYQGFAKQNYTMLDNLKLGYGGTKTEMERLLKDAEKISGQKYDISNLNDVYSAIHVIQGELGITGTTAKEAATTLEGSMTSAKAAWDNFMNGSGDAQQLADAFGTAAENIIKNLNEIIPRLVSTLPALIKAVAAQIPSLVMSLVPAVVNAVFDLMKELENFVTTFDWAGAAQKVVDAITSFIDSGGFEQFVQSAANIITGLATGLAQALPKLIPAVIQLVAYLATTLIQHIPEIIKAGFELILALGTGFVNALPDIGNALLQVVQAIWGVIKQLPGIFWEVFGDVLTKLYEWASQMLSNAGAAMSNMLSSIISWISQLPGQFWTWLVNTINKVIQWRQQLISNASSALQNMLSTVVTWISQLPGEFWTWLVNTINKVIQWRQQLISNASSALSSMISTIISWLSQLPEKFWTWLANTASKVVQWGSDLKAKGAEAAKGLFDAVVNGVKDLPSKMLDIGKNIVSGIWDGISSGWSWLTDKVSSLASSLLDAAKGALGINSPSREFRDQVGRFLPPGISEGFDRAMPAAIKDMQKQADKMVGQMQLSVATSAGSLTANASGAAGLRALTTAGTTVYNDNHLEQANTYNVPVPTPSEVSKNQREALRNMVGGVK